jgi:hypothetical protein
VTEYRGYVPPCGIFCGGCPRYLRERNPCPGAEIRCLQRKCKGIYVCCVEKRQYRFCFECDISPCSRFKAFADTWHKHGQDLIRNQEDLQELGEVEWIQYGNES